MKPGASQLCSYYSEKNRRKSAWMKRKAQENHDEADAATTKNKVSSSSSSGRGGGDSITRSTASFLRSSKLEALSPPISSPHRSRPSGSNRRERERAYRLLEAFPSHHLCRAPRLIPENAAEPRPPAKRSLSPRLASPRLGSRVNRSPVGSKQPASDILCTPVDRTRGTYAC